MEQLDQSGYELRKLHGSDTNANYGLNKMSKKKQLWMDFLVLLTWMKMQIVIFVL